MLASVIMERPGYDEMTPQEVLSKLKHHECLDEDAINTHNQNPNGIGYNKSAALKATQKHEVQGSSQEKKKKVKDDSSSEEEDSDEEVAFVIRNLRKFMKKKSNRKTYGDGRKRYKKRFCYGCGKTGHFIADCPKEKKKNKYNKNDNKKNKGKKRGEAHLGEEWESNDSDSSDDEKKKKGATNIAIHHSSSPTMIFPDSSSPQNSSPTYLHHRGSSPTSSTVTTTLHLASWLRGRRYMTHPLLLIMNMIVVMRTWKKLKKA